MRRDLLETLHNYFVSISEKTEQESDILRQIEERLEFFPITHVSRDDLKSKGFDVSNVSDAEMEKLAQKMSDDYLTQLFWESMEILAEAGMKFPRLPFCPKCESHDYELNVETGENVCMTCETRWSDIYVLVQHPEDSSYFEQEEIGYPCFNSEDNGARYVPEYEYILQFQKSPEPNAYFQPVMWPDSQEYFELPDNLRELCENIETGQAFEDFGSGAIWVPLCLMTKNA